MVTYFRPNDFTKCITSVLKNTRHPFHLTIIDNSQGGLDSVLVEFEGDSRITIIRNTSNIGKGQSFRKWAPIIINESEYFISIDADVEVPEYWLTRLQTTYLRIKRHQLPGILAPRIVDSNDIPCMHGTEHVSPVSYSDTIFHNRNIAGPLFFINTEFYTYSGGYTGRQLYAADDGPLCAAAIKSGRFVGIDESVTIKHLDEDNTIGYANWKLNHITKDGPCTGYWDQSHNRYKTD